MYNNLLPLVRDLHGLAFCADRCVGRRFFGCDCELLVLELCKGHGPDRHKTHFLEALEALEDCREVVFVDIPGDVLEEKRLVRPHVFVGDNCCSSLCCAGLLGGGGRIGCRLSVFVCLLDLCAWSVCALYGLGGGIVPLAINRLRLCSSNISVAFRLTVSSLCVCALRTFIALPYISNPFISSTASSVDFSLSKMTNAWPLRFRLLLAMMSSIGP
jgi:hypothetical protein